MADELKPNNTEIQSEKLIDRREFGNFMKVMLVGGLASALMRSSAGPKPEIEETPVPPEVIENEPKEPFEEYPLQPSELIFHENSYFEFENGERKVELAGMGWYPDGHIPFVTLDDGVSKLMWITGHLSGTQGSFPYIWNPYTGITPNVDANNYIIPAVSREPYEATQSFRNGYAGLTSVMPFSGGFLGFTHNEEWRSSNNGAGFKASVGLSFSQDGAKTFGSLHPLITGRETRQPGQEVTGAGQPCAIKVKDASGQEYAYIYYIEWLPQEVKNKAGAVDQIYLSRIPLDNNEVGAVEYLTNSGFQRKTEGSFLSLKPVITPPSSIGNSGYAALPSVSYNYSKNTLLAVFETNVGVCATESSDGINWEPAELVIGYPIPLSSVWQNHGSESYSYPTLLDLSQDNAQFTGESLTMVLAKGIGHGRSHSMIAVKGKLKK